MLDDCLFKLIKVNINITEVLEFADVIRNEYLRAKPIFSVNNCGASDCIVK